MEARAAASAEMNKMFEISQKFIANIGQSEASHGSSNGRAGAKNFAGPKGPRFESTLWVL